MPKGIAVTSVVLRIVTNAAAFALIGALFNVITALTLAGIGAVLGAVHAFALVKCKAYPDTSRGWALLIIDHTWSLLNTVVGSIFLVANLIAGNQLDTIVRTGRTTVVLKKGVSRYYATTIGPVEAGTDAGVDKHEYIHVIQSRLLGPAYIPLVLAHYVINTILPYWLLYHDHAKQPINSIGNYFIDGVYMNVWNELWARAASET